MQTDLTGQVVAITGSGRGIGRAAALARLPAESTLILAKRDAPFRKIPADCVFRSNEMTCQSRFDRCVPGASSE